MSRDSGKCFARGVRYDDAAIAADVPAGLLDVHPWPALHKGKDIRPAMLELMRFLGIPGGIPLSRVAMEPDVSESGCDRRVFALHDQIKRRLLRPWLEAGERFRRSGDLGAYAEWKRAYGAISKAPLRELAELYWQATTAGRLFDREIKIAAHIEKMAERRFKRR